MNDWMTDDTFVLKALHRKYESLWHKMYSGSCMAVKTAISKSRSGSIGEQCNQGDL